MPTIDINQDAVVFLATLRVVGGNNIGIRTSGGTVWIDRSQIAANDDGDLQVISGTLTLRNSYVGGGLVNFNAVSVLSGDVDLVYSTVVGGAINSLAVSCADGSGVRIRNSLVVSAQAGAEIACVGADVVSNALEMNMPGNTSLGMMDVGWFEDYAQGDFSLTLAAPPAIATAATWQTGDPATDIDGDARPNVDGTPDYAGADVTN